MTEALQPDVWARVEAHEDPRHETFGWSIEFQPTLSMAEQSQTILALDRLLAARIVAVSEKYRENANLVVESPRLSPPGLVLAVVKKTEQTIDVRGPAEHLLNALVHLLHSIHFGDRVNGDPDDYARAYA